MKLHSFFLKGTGYKKRALDSQRKIRKISTRSKKMKILLIDTIIAIKLRPAKFCKIQEHDRPVGLELPASKYSFRTEANLVT